MNTSEIIRMPLGIKNRLLGARFLASLFAEDLLVFIVKLLKIKVVK